MTIVALPPVGGYPPTTPTTIVLDLFPTTDWTLGNTLRIRATIRDTLSGTLVDPDNLLFRTVQGGAAAITYTYSVDANVPKIEVGVYDLILTLTASGKGKARAIAAGSRPLSAVAQWQSYDPDF